MFYNWILSKGSETFKTAENQQQVLSSMALHSLIQKLRDGATSQI